MTTTADNHPGDHGTATASSGAATDAHVAGQITTESLSTAAGASYTLTITDPLVQADSVVLASVALGSSTTGTPMVFTITPAAGSVVIKIYNNHASAAFNGTLVVSFIVF